MGFHVIVKIKHTMSQKWQNEWWYVVPLIVFAINFVCTLLTGAGHAPFIGYLPLLLLWGPLVVPAGVFQWGNIYQSGSMGAIYILVAPSFLYLAYLAILRITSLERRWAAFMLVALTHLSFSLIITGYLIYRRLHGQFEFIEFKATHRLFRKLQGGAWRARATPL
jgi:hypothetical protein